jgi:hypothetical protein
MTPYALKNASRVHQTSIVELFFKEKTFPPIFFNKIFFPHMKKTVDPALLTQKLWRTLIGMLLGVYTVTGLTL